MTNYNDMVQAMATHKGDFVVFTKTNNQIDFEETLITSDLNVVSNILDVVGLVNIDWEFSGNSLLFWVS